MRFCIIILLIIFHDISFGQISLDSLNKIENQIRLQIAMLNDSLKVIAEKRNIIKYEQTQRLAISDTTLFETTVKTIHTLIKREPAVLSMGGTDIYKGVKVKLAAFSSEDGRYFYWKLSTGGFIDDEDLDQTADMKRFKTKENEKINERIKREKKLEDEKNSIAYQERLKPLIKRFGETNAKKIDFGLIWIGMTDDMAIYSIGRADAVNKTQFSYGIQEQWIYNREIPMYGSNVYLYFENSVLKVIQSSR